MQPISFLSKAKHYTKRQLLDPICYQLHCKGISDMLHLHQIIPYVILIYINFDMRISSTFTSILLQIKT